MLMRNISCFCIKKMPGMSLLVGCVCHAWGEREMRIGLTMRQPLIEDGSRQSKRGDGGSNRCWWQSRGEVVSLAAA